MAEPVGLGKYLLHGCGEGNLTGSLKMLILRVFEQMKLYKPRYLTSAI